LTNETDIKSYQTKLREVEKAHEEVTARLTKREREMEVRAAERDELLDTVNKMKSKLEKEAGAVNESRQQVADLGRYIEELKGQVGILTWSAVISTYFVFKTHTFVIAKCVH